MKKLFYYLKKEMLLTKDTYLFLFILKAVFVTALLLLPLFMDKTLLEVARQLIQVIISVFVIVTPFALVQKSNSNDRKNLKDIKILPGSKVSYFLTKFLFIFIVFISETVIANLIFPISFDRFLLLVLLTIIPLISLIMIIFLKKYIKAEFKINFFVITLVLYLSYYFLNFIVFFYALTDAYVQFQNYDFVVYSLLFSLISVSLWSYYFDKRCEL